MCRDDFLFATILGQLLSDALIWPQHFPMRIRAKCIRHRTICAAITNHTCAESLIQLVNLVPANDTNTTFSFPKSCLSGKGKCEISNRHVHIGTHTLATRPTHRILARHPFVGFYFGKAHVAGHITQLNYPQRITIFGAERQRLVITAQCQNVISRPGTARYTLRMFAQNRYSSENQNQFSHRVKTIDAHTHKHNAHRTN